jgi:FkbM family methyltransferase
MHINWPSWMRALKRRLLPPRPGRIAVGPGRGLRFDPGAGNPAYASGANELPVQEELARLLRPGDIVIDIGANVGFLSVIAAKLVGPDGRVIAFEPVPANARRIRRNARLNRLGRIEVVEAAVGDRTGTATLVLAEFAGGAALADADLPPDACGELEVRLTTLDDWLARSGSPRPALVKIDVEGAELAVLRGMVATLEQVRPALLIELDDATAIGAEAKAAACDGFCAERGYHVRRLPDSYPGIAWHVIHLLATTEGTVPAPEARA